MNVAFLGMGAMGVRMSANLLKAGYPVVVWNRTASACEKLVSMGATQAATPADAVRNADVVIAMLRDDEASKEVWLTPVTGALAGMKTGAIAVESSTLTPAWIKELNKQIQQAGMALLEAPVSGSRPQAEAGKLVFLLGGDSVTLNKVNPLLEQMGSSIQHVGAIGDGALAKLATNTLLGMNVTVLAELIGIITKAGADPAQIFKGVAATSSWSMAAGGISSMMLNGNFAPQFPVELISKDFNYTLSAAGQPVCAPVIEAARDVFTRAAEHDLAKENMTSVVKLYL